MNTKIQRKSIFLFFVIVGLYCVCFDRIRSVIYVSEMAQPMAQPMAQQMAQQMAQPMAQ